MILEEFKPNVEIINMALKQYLSNLETPQPLKESMQYSLLSGGKRIRPLILLATLEAFEKDIALGLPVACAVEMIHTYSLIHDDLPAMDDDDYRRGRLTNHKVYGEATAILAGDALLTYSFQILADAGGDISETQKLALVYELAKAAGPEGMVAGQMADLDAENRAVDLEELEYVHIHKTGKLLAFCVKAGAILANADDKTTRLLDEFAYHIGLAFQIQDDILDVEGSSELMGKSSGSDENKQKSTYPKLLTLAGAKKKLEEHLTRAKEILEELPLETDKLEKLTDIIGLRKH